MATVDEVREAVIDRGVPAHFIETIPGGDWSGFLIISASSPPFGVDREGTPISADRYGNVIAYSTVDDLAAVMAVTAMDTEEPDTVAWAHHRVNYWLRVMAREPDIAGSEGWAIVTRRHTYPPLDVSGVQGIAHELEPRGTFPDVDNPVRVVFHWDRSDGEVHLTPWVLTPPGELSELNPYPAMSYQPTITLSLRELTWRNAYPSRVNRTRQRLVTAIDKIKRQALKDLVQRWHKHDQWTLADAAKYCGITVDSYRSSIGRNNRWAPGPVPPWARNRSVDDDLVDADAVRRWHSGYQPKYGPHV